MPYEIRKGSSCSDDKPFAVVKQSDGKLMGCHATEVQAKKQLAALYANEKQMHEKTAIKRENGIDYPPRDYAYVPDPLSPSTWKLRLTEKPGVISANQLGRAAAAISPGGFRGNRVDIPQGALSSVKRRIRAEYRRLGVDESKIPHSVKELSELAQDGLTVWKEAETGRHRWFAVYSNNYRDDDNPPEIIAQKSHENFVEMVDAGLVDYPEAWLWHVPGTAWGKADWVAYADGFALASGYVYAGKEHIAENLAKEKGLMVSHGMPRELMIYDPQDPSTIIFHVTAEISPLLHGKAANKLTGFVVLDKGESTMALPEEKKSWLKKMGVTDTALESIDNTLKSMAAAAQSAGIESKEQAEAASEEPVAEQAEVVEDAEVKAADDAEGEMEEGKKPAKRGKKKEAVADVPVVAYVTKEEVAGAVAETVMPMIEAINALKTQVASLSKELSELRQSDEEKIAETKELTPSLSLSEIIAQNIIGKESARVDGRSVLGKDRPAEKEVPAALNTTPIPFLNGLVHAAQNSIGSRD